MYRKYYRFVTQLSKRKWLIKDNSSLLCKPSYEKCFKDATHMSMDFRHCRCSTAHSRRRFPPTFQLDGRHATLPTTWCNDKFCSQRHCIQGTIGKSHVRSNWLMLPISSTIAQLSDHHVTFLCTTSTLRDPPHQPVLVALHRTDSPSLNANSNICYNLV